MWITGLWGSYVPGTASSKSRHIRSLGETYWSSRDVNWNTQNAQSSGFNNDSIRILVYGLSYWMGPSWLFAVPVGVVWRFAWKPSSTNPRPVSDLWHFLIVDTFCTIPGLPSDRDHMPDRKEQKHITTTNLMKKLQSTDITSNCTSNWPTDKQTNKQMGRNWTKTTDAVTFQKTTHLHIWSFNYTWLNEVSLRVCGPLSIIWCSGSNAPSIPFTLPSLK